MKKSEAIAPPAAAIEDATVFVAFELSKAKWKLGIVQAGSQKMSRYTVPGGDTAAVLVLLGKAREKAAARGPAPVRVVSCYEAGYDGFWLHRWLAGQGVVNHVLDPASIAVERRMRRVKTDRIDLEKLMRVLLAHWRGEPRVCSVVRPPSVAAEDARRRHRERQRLIKERGAHINRIKGLLHGQGIRDAEPLARGFLAGLAELRTGDGHPVSPALGAEIAREHDRLLLLVRQVAALEAEIQQIIAAAPAPLAAPAAAGATKAAQLLRVKGIGPATAQLLAHEVYYRDFANRRQLGGYLGLTGTPFASGQVHREQGISKAGNPRARAAMIELAWFWLLHQPGSELSRWFVQRVGSLKGRIRKIAIVALARKLAVALWRYLETGVVPNGTALKPAA